MQLVVVSPEHDRADEIAVLVELFAAGLERYHVRKPALSSEALAKWIKQVPEPWRSRLVLHQHHQWVDQYGLGGRHWKDRHADETSTPSRPLSTFMSRSCHDLPALRSSLGRYDAVFYGPVFASISKRGYGSGDGLGREALAAVLHTRSEFERRTAVLAIGGVNLETACRARALGFDGVAVLGAIWHAADPIGAFNALAAGCRTARLALPVPSPALGV